ncbi:hypothetical protein AGMMS4952_26020 [Spirochaetia bacterium]|nr:hypothetical protein AGMMS4952_26020 [Spirochaetia bacterium]
MNFVGTQYFFSRALSKLIGIATQILRLSPKQCLSPNKQI